MPSPNPPAPNVNRGVWFAFVVLLCIVVSQEVRWQRRFDRFARESADLAPRVDEMTAQTESLRQSVAALDATATERTRPSPGFPGMGESSTSNHGTASPVASRMASIEQQVQRLQAALGPRGLRPAISEYDPAQPPPELPASEEPTATRGGTGRSWGTEQVVGAPNTPTAGDQPTAWASREPDGGPEWLQAGFDRPVDISEIRVRETYNPGAISKVTALSNGQEVVLWEGTAAPGPAPRDFVIRPVQPIQADSVLVHLDTARVAGWNEIDAVELVGRDGTRQWASSSRASSTYADRSARP